LVVLLFLTWILLSGKVSISVCASGALVSGLLYLAANKTLGYGPAMDLKIAGKLWKGLCYLGYLLWDMLRAGFVVMHLIYARGQKIEPRLIWFHTALTTPVGQAALANAITLTAGTITVCQEGDLMCIHTLDRSLAEGMEHSGFEKHLKELEQ